MAKKNDARVALPNPFLGYFKSMAERTPSYALNVHVMDRMVWPPGAEAPTVFAACGERTPQANLARYQAAELTPAQTKRVRACITCCGLFPSYFDCIPRTLS